MRLAMESTSHPKFCPKKPVTSVPPTKKVARTLSRVGFGEGDEDAVHEVLLALLAIEVAQLRAQRVETGAAAAPHREDEQAGDVEVDLDPRVLDLVAQRRRVEDHEDVLRVGVDLRALAELARVLERDRVQVEVLAELGEVRVGRVVQVEPEEVVGVAQRGEVRPVRLGEDLHR